MRDLPWKAVSLDVELGLAEDGEKTPRWQAARLLFVRGLKESGEADAGKKDWALFLTTDVHLCAIRYLMLMHNKLVGHDSRIGGIQSNIQEQLVTLSFAGRLWQIFRSIISGASKTRWSLRRYSPICRERSSLGHRTCCRKAGCRLLICLTEAIKISPSKFVYPNGRGSVGLIPGVTAKCAWRSSKVRG